MFLTWCVSDDDTVAKRLFKEVRVLVWVMTAPKNLATKAAAVRDTWGRRANKLIFFSSETNKDFPTIGLNVSEGREHLTAKTTQGFRYIYKHHLNDADWFMKVSTCCHAPTNIPTYTICRPMRVVWQSSGAV